MSNYFVFSIEGLDGSGKETTAKAVVEQLKTEFPNVEIVMHSFPDYDIPSGKRIKSVLGNPESKEDIQKLFIQNRADVCNILKEQRENKDVIYIFDRYYHSNAFYQTLGMTKKEILNYIYQQVECERDGGVDLFVDKVYYLNTPLALSIFRVNKRKMIDKFYAQYDSYETNEHMKKIYNHSKYVLDALRYDTPLKIVNSVDDGILLTPKEIAMDIVLDIKNFINTKGGF